MASTILFFSGAGQQGRGLLGLALGLLIWLSVALPGQAAPAETLAIVSDRSAPYLVAAAHQLQQEGAGVGNLQLRTVSQLETLSDAELTRLLSGARSLLLVAVFGDAVERLLHAPLPRDQYRMVLHSDRRLMALQRSRGGALFAQDLPAAIVNEKDMLFSAAERQAFENQHPDYADWIRARAYWLNRSVNNAAALWALVASGGEALAAVEPVAPLRFYLHGNTAHDRSNPAADGAWLSQAELQRALAQAKPAARRLWVVDHDTGDLAGEWDLHRQLCAASQWQCISVLAAWGQSTVAAVQTIAKATGSAKATATAVVAMQDFVMGGGEGRKAVSRALAELNVPVLKGIRIGEWREAQWRLSDQGVPRDAVHYRLAMPELQGVSQPQVLALAEPLKQDPLTGASLYRSKPLADEITRQAGRLSRWLALQEKPNADKRVAIVYYNHPPGRHNIGADNLNVPESLLEILRALQGAGYDTGPLPANGEALLDQLQDRGVNLPEDAQALAALSGKVASLTGDDYRAWFSKLPGPVQAEMVDGPLGALLALVKDQTRGIAGLPSASARKAQVELLQRRVHSTLTDLHHALDGLRNKGRERALDLLDQLGSEFDLRLGGLVTAAEPDWQQSDRLVEALLAMGIEGIRGWGEPPGKVMVWQGRQLIPGLQFGKVFIGPQPPRGWELNEELLHANLSFPPPHQYLGFYHYLRDVFKADALIHVGRHSTYEFLPKRSVGLSADDYPSIVAADLPGIYPYIVDGVGEGIQAKRRGLAVMVDHLTPPLAITELYDDLLELRQLIESAEAASDSQTRRSAVARLRQRIDELELRDELVASMDEELKVRGIGFDEVDEDFLLHEVGHYLTKLQEGFMPLGLHVFGRDWQADAVTTMVNSMLDGRADQPAEARRWQALLQSSPGAEMAALLNGLRGGFVAPGKGNDPIRTPEALPTGRNFYALDGSLLPTKLAYQTGAILANRVLSGEEGVAAHTTDVAANKQGVILWASDAVRDEGAMIAFGMKLMGITPVWNSRGIIKGLERLPLSEAQPKRFDVVFTTSGLFRDLYGEHLLLLDKASLLALDASADRIVARFPALSLALKAALAPLGEWQQGGDEPLEKNQVANNWVDQARKILASDSGISALALGRQASARVFGITPGAYGAGINRMVERSGSWQDRSELAAVFTKRMGHAYGVGLEGAPAQDLFRQQLQGISQTYLGRASNLYGLIDNNDAFDYLGGFNLAVEQQRGAPPASAVINHARGDQLQIDNLDTALLSELRGRFFNPQWIKPLMKEGYAGARTMGSEFIEYLWGWQVTSPDIINDRVWQEVKAVYVDDALELGLDKFLAEGHNRYVQTNILAVMLVAIDKGFWQADDATVQQLAEQFANNIVAHGNPGSGHTHANHPMYALVKSRLPAEQAAALEAALASARLPETPRGVAAEGGADQASHIQEVSLAEQPPADEEMAAEGGAESMPASLRWGLVMVAAGLLLVGFWRGRRQMA